MYLFLQSFLILQIEKSCIFHVGVGSTSDEIFLFKETTLQRYKSMLQIRCQHPLDETHLDAVRGLILPRAFHPAHQQVELVGAMRLCSTRTNRSAYAYAKDLIQS